MAAGGIPLIAEQGARLLARKVEHLRALRHGLGKLELTGIDAHEIVVPSGPRRGTSVRRRAVFEKPGRREFGTARTSITRFTPACVSAARNSPTVVASYPMVKMRSFRAMPSR